MNVKREKKLYDNSDVDIDKGQKKSGKKSSAVIFMRLPEKIDHGTVLKHLMRLPCVQEVNEV